MPFKSFSLYPFSMLESFYGSDVASLLGVIIYLVHFIFLPILGVALFFFMLFNSEYWAFLAAYMAWYFYDAKTPQRGGRLNRSLRNWKVWKCMRDYFPITLYKDGNLDPAHNYIMSYHPHGITVFGAFANFATCSTGFHKLFPGLECRLLTLQAYFNVPFLRDYLLLSGCCNVHKESFRSLLSNEKKGVCVTVVPGGAEEALESRPDKMSIILKNRHGFTKMALRTGSHLVPVLSFGENETYLQVANPRGSVLRKVQTKLTEWFTFSPPLFYGRGRTIIPFKTPINTVVGSPIEVEKIEEPSWSEVCDLHQKYERHLRDLFEKYKTQFGYPENYQLEIL